MDADQRTNLTIQDCVRVHHENREPVKTKRLLPFGGEGAKSIMEDYSKRDNRDSVTDSDPEPADTTTPSTRAVTSTPSVSVESGDAAGSSMSQALCNQLESLRYHIATEDMSYIGRVLGGEVFQRHVYRSAVRAE